MMTMIPKEAKRIPTRPLALGEVTGHHHSLVEAEACEMYEKDGEIYVRIVDETALTHQEHKPHVTPANAEGEVIIASEVTDWGRRPVVD